ncbi:amino acid adenylation domain-containing protein [Legionella hackeliae]|uniref:Putative non-ribosomal peptide synthetase n=1 Tax=Legionella hackeliae TaxID=449 RepID=A0A0A8US27_LEGHA|nr:amino acid adenylation domain-containing protein [Legionella hackeliae]KTD08904.1 non-ribosomal peptide synthetase [Legionella hackeliae]CEK10336.1 putative non-ribosomal peptide synthetase [Legionella hackeliae]STX47066.1 non-ribosomal peptide synthetase [Legionella hackeliae]
MENSEQLNEFLETEVKHDAKTLHGLFEEQAKHTPQQLAVIFGEQTISYEQLNQKANQLAHYLQQMAVKPDTQVAVCMERSIDLLIVILGILKAGGAYIPLDSSHPEERLLLILKEGGTQFLITIDKFKKRFSRYQGDVVLMDKEDEIKKQSTKNPRSNVNARNLAYIIYTSGSTGTPKGVVVEHRGVVDYSLWFAEYCDCQPGERIDFSSNHAFDFALTTSIIPLMLGLTLVICADKIKKDPRQYLKYLNTHEVNFIKLTPSYFRVLIYEVKNKHIDLPYLKKIMLAGESLFSSDCSAWLALYPDHILYNEYGPTETSVAVCLYKIDRKNIHRLGANVPIGHVAPHIQSYILDENRMPVGEGETGELYLGGSCLARGYLNNPDLTRQYFIQHPFNPDIDAKLYKTGDLCRRLIQGEIECLGRIDHQLKIRGFRVEPGEIEICLIGHSAIKEAVVLAANEEQKETRLVAYYILNDSKVELDSTELRQHLLRHLPDYMVPSSFVRMDSFPLNANEKLDRAALPIPQFTASQYYIAPKTHLEKNLAQIWSEELEIKPIGLKDDFFELGGHSLAAARIISTVNHKLGKDVKLYDFYSQPTIAHLASLIKKAKKKGKRRVINKAFLNATQFPLSNFQLLLWLADTFEPKAKRLNIFARKRFEGRLNIDKLNRAFEAVFKKHDVFSYSVSKLQPLQCLQKKIGFQVIEKNLESFSEKNSEQILESSIQELIEYNSWPKNKYPIVVRLFYLKNNLTELQLCLPHMISDDLSPEILLSDLSSFYNSAIKGHKTVKKDIAFRNYLLEEQTYMQQHINRDLKFWDDYLKDAALFAFPTEQVVHSPQNYQFSYSTYREIPEETLNSFHVFCKHQHTSVFDGLCAALMMALLNISKNNQDIPEAVYVNRVKSTRDNPDYDSTFGGFLRLEPIKLRINKSSNLTSLLQQVHESVITTHPYQQCSDLIKLANISTFRQKPPFIKNYVIKGVVWLYTTIFRSVKLDRRILNLCGRLGADKKNNFLVNMNVQHSFLGNSHKRNNSNIFGFETRKIRDYHYDLLKINNLLDVCFLRMVGSNAPHLIISANLQPAFRALIANEVIRVMRECCSTQ